MKRAIGQVTGTKQDGGVAVDVLGDIRKAFETLVRELLWQYAIKEGYPLDLLYMALNAHCTCWASPTDWLRKKHQ